MTLNRLKRNLWFWLGLALLSATVVFVWVLPVAMELGLEKVLQARGRAAAVEDIDFNPFTGRFTLYPTRVGPDEDTLKLNRVQLRLRLLPFLSHTIEISEVVVDGLSIQVQRNAEGKFIFQGITFPGSESPDTGSTPPPRPWALGAERVRLSNVQVAFSDVGVQHQLTVDNAELDAFHSRHLDRETQVQITGTADSSSFELTGKFSIPESGADFSGHLRLARLPLARLQPYLDKLEVEALTGRGEADLSVQGSWKSADKTFTLELAGTAGLEEFEFRLNREPAPLRLTLDTLKAQADLKFKQPPESELAITGKGTVQAEALFLEHPSSRLTAFKLARAQMDAFTLDQTVFSASSLVLESVSAEGHTDETPASPAYQSTLGRLEILGAELARPSSDLKGSSLTMTDLGLQVMKSPKEIAQGEVRTPVVMTLNVPSTRMDDFTLDQAALRASRLVLESASAESRTTETRTGPAYQSNLGRLELLGAELARPSLEARGSSLAVTDLGFEVMESPTDNALSEKPSPLLAELKVASGQMDDFVMETASLRAAGLVLENVSAKGHTAEAVASPAYKGTLGRLEVRETAIDRAAADFEVSSVTLTELVGEVTRPPRPATEEPPVDSSTQPPASRTDKEHRGSVKLGSLQVSGASRLTWVDQAVKPRVEIPVTIENVNLESGTSADRETAFEGEFKIGEYATLKTKGNFRILPEGFRLDFDGQMRGLDLPILNPYAAKSIGYTVRNGRADLDWKILREPTSIKGETKTSLTRIELDPAPTGSEKFNQVFGVPASAVLTFLRDGDGDIQLDVPIEGDPSSPDYKFGSIVAKATGKAMREAAISYFGPMGVTALTGVVLPPGTMLLLGKALDWALTVRFKPVPFETGTAELSTDGLTYLDEVAVRLQDRPKVRLLFCGFATRADLLPTEDDISASETELGEKAQPPGHIQSPEPLSEEGRTLLLQLAEERSRTVRDYLVKEKGIGSERLYLCQPEVDTSKEAQPRVEVSG